MRGPSWITKNKDQLVAILSLIFSFSLYLFNENFADAKYIDINAGVVSLLKWLKGCLSLELMIASGSSILLLIVVLPVFRSFFERTNEDWSWLRFFVERARNKAYEEILDPEPHYDRVTLFKYVKRLPRKYRHWSAKDLKKWPILNGLGVGTLVNHLNRGGEYRVRSGWLVPVIRSDHDDSSCLKGTVFAVPRGDLDAYEGLGAAAFRKSETIVRIKLPKASSSTNETNRIKYANKSNCPIGMVDVMINSRSSLDVVLPRTVGAIPLQNSNGGKWGVLVFDSRNADAFPGNVNSALLLNGLFETTINGMVKALGEE